MTSNSIHTTFDSIQPLALRVREDALPLTQDCITLAFPQHWASGFKRLQAAATNRPVDKVTVPIASLNRTLRAVVPPIISIERGATGYKSLSRGRPWLYVSRQVDAAVLISVIHSWARVLFRAAPDDLLHQVLATVQTHDVQWKVESLNLLDWHENTGGTATPAHPAQFILFPDYVAATLSSLPKGFEYGAHQLHFRRSSLPPGQRGAELTSWPPLQDGNALYSVVLTFTMQTIPFQSYPVLYCDASLRRWAGPGRVFLKQRASTYISTSLPFVSELDGLGNQLQVASLKRRLNQQGEWASTWDDHLVEILKRLGSKVSLLDATTLTDTPAVGQQDWNNAAAIVYSTRMRRHRIGAGVAIRERGQIFDQLTDLFHHLFEPVAPFPRKRNTGPHKISLSANAFFKKVENDKKKTMTGYQRVSIKEANEQIWAERRALIRETVGERVCIEICAPTTDVRENLCAALQSVLGICVNDGLTQEISTPELTIGVAFRSLDTLTDNLELGTGKTVREQVRDATQRRISEVGRQLPKAEGPTLMLAEILPKGKYATNSDPKSPLRIGIGRSRRVVQFITADDESSSADETSEEEPAASLQYRAQNALLDGLRQLGVPGKLPTPVNADRPCTVIGAWLINKNSTKSGSESYTLPVLVRISSLDQRILAMAPGFTDWLPYREALLELARTDVLGSQQSRADYTAFFRTQLRQAASEQHDTLLICHAQKMRETWSWLSNSHLVPDAITFRTGEPATPIAEWPGLRIVRVRDAQSHETPEWFAESDGWRSAAAGLFKMGERVYASAHAKPKQMKSYSHYFSKAEDWESPKRLSVVRKPMTRVSTWNPGLYELTVAALQSGDNSEPWAHLTHELRKACLHYEDATALPLPLHLAKLMEEYILSVEIQDDEEG